MQNDRQEEPLKFIGKCQIRQYVGKVYNLQLPVLDVHGFATI